MYGNYFIFHGLFKNKYQVKTLIKQLIGGEQFLTKLNLTFLTPNYCCSNLIAHQKIFTQNLSQNNSLKITLFPKSRRTKIDFNILLANIVIFAFSETLKNFLKNNSQKTFSKTLFSNS
jgi:hypothetical protein